MTLPSGATATALVVLEITRTALPVLLAASLLATRSLSWPSFSRRRQPIHLDALPDVESMSEEGEKPSISTDPPRAVLSLLLDLFSVSHAIELVMLLAQAAISGDLQCSKVEIFAIWSTLVAYSSAAYVYARDHRSGSTGQRFLRCFSASTLVACILQLGSLMALVQLGR